MLISIFPEFSGTWWLTACFHAGNNPKQQRQSYCHPLSLPLSAHLDVSLRFMSCYTSLSAGEAAVVPVCLCWCYVSELSIPQRQTPAALISRGLLLIKQVRLGVLTARRLASRHIFSAGLGLICMRGVCEDGWTSCQPGDTDPFSVSGLGAVAALTETSWNQPDVNTAHFIFPQQETQSGLILL